jgi:hypothetical protein
MCGYHLHWPLRPLDHKSYYDVLMDASIHEREMREVGTIESESEKEADSPSKEKGHRNVPTYAA